MYMRHLFEGGVYFVGGLHRVRHLFEGGIYSRAAFNQVNMVLRQVLLACKPLKDIHMYHM